MLVTAKDILKKVSEVTHISEREINGRSRLEDISNARKLYWVCLRMNGYGVDMVSKIANRDHSTVAKLTRDYYAEAKITAYRILKSLGAEVFEMMIQPQKFLKLNKEEKTKYCKLSNNAKLKVYASIPTIKRPQIILKRVPDYKNYTIKTVWRIADDY